MRKNKENKKGKPKVEKEKKFSPIPDFTKVYGFAKPTITSVTLEEDEQEMLQFTQEEIINYPVMSKSINLEAMWNTLKNPPEYMGSFSKVEFGDVKVELKTTGAKMKKLYDLFAKNFEDDGFTKKNILTLNIKYEGFLDDEHNVFMGLGMLAELGQELEKEAFYFVFKPNYFTSYNSRR